MTVPATTDPDYQPPKSNEQMLEMVRSLPDSLQRSILWNPLLAHRAHSVAQTFAGSGMLPDGLKPAGVMVCIDIAIRTGRDPLSVCQSVYFVRGRAGWNATYLIALAKEEGCPLKWKVTHLENGDIEVACFSDQNEDPDAYAKVTLSMAKKMGWTKESNNWAHNPELMLRYRAATQYVRLYLPHIILGLGNLPVADELHDVIDAGDYLTPGDETPKTGLEAVDQLLGGEPSAGNTISPVEDGPSKSVPTGDSTPSGSSEPEPPSSQPSSPPVNEAPEDHAPSTGESPGDNEEPTEDDDGSSAEPDDEPSIADQIRQEITELASQVGDLEKAREMVGELSGVDLVGEGWTIEKAVWDIADEAVLDRIRMGLRQMASPEPEPSEKPDPRKELSAKLKTLKSKLGTAKWQLARSRAGVQRLDKTSPVQRYRDLVNACEQVLSESEESSDAKASVPKATKHDTIESVGALIERLGLEDRRAVCAAALVPYDYDNNMPMWDGCGAGKLAALKKAAEDLL